MKTFIIITFFAISIYPQVTTKLYPFDGGEYHTFGYKLTVDSNFFVISAFNGSLASGAIYVYRKYKNVFRFAQKILPDTAHGGYFFGSPIFLKDSLLFVGANSIVFIYKIWNDSTFKIIDTLVPFDPIQTEQYGRAISGHNKNLFVGAYLDGSEDKGAAYFYEFIDTSWIFLQKIYPSSLERNAHFGDKIVHTDEFAVISAAGDGFESGPFRGTVFLFEKTDSGWIEKQKILPSDSTYYQLFGIDLALDNKRIAIGAVGNILNQLYNGRIYIYEISDEGFAVLQDSIFASDNFPGNNFGWSFKLRGDSLFVGASGNQYMSSIYKTEQRNWAYLFVKTTDGWEQKMIFGPSDPHPQNVFGYAVDFLDGNFLVGSPGDPTNGFQSGSIYLFQPNLSSVEDSVSLPDKFYLLQNYPNPYNSSTKIKFSIPTTEFVQINIYDILGNKIRVLLNKYKQAGIYEVEFDARNLSSGIYFYRIITGKYIETKKMILLR